MLMIALLGLIVNLASILILRGSHKEDLNVKSIFYHMIADAASSVGIVLAAVVIFYTGWNIIDPILSLGISAIIVYWALGLLRDSARVLLEMAPPGLNVDIIGDNVKSNFAEIKDIYNIHLWTITTDMLVFTGHIKLNDPSINKEDLISRINKHLHQKYGIIESTIQIASEGEEQVCNIAQQRT
jgi:cobalt-zinc-cadmium efflux system protein